VVYLKGGDRGGGVVGVGGCLIVDFGTHGGRRKEVRRGGGVVDKE